jgi:hypothetical protein
LLRAATGPGAHRVEAHEDERVQAGVVYHVLVGDVEQEAYPAAGGQRRQASSARVGMCQRSQRRNARFFLAVRLVGGRLVCRVGLLFGHRQQRARAE